jgi:hypothetical protein
MAWRHALYYSSVTDGRLTVLSAGKYTSHGNGERKDRAPLSNKLNFLFAGLALATLTGCSGGGQMGSSAATQGAQAAGGGMAAVRSSQGGSSITGNAAQNSPSQPMTAPNPGMMMMSPNPSPVASDLAADPPTMTASDPAADPPAPMGVASDPAADPPAAMGTASDPLGDPPAMMSLDPPAIGATDPPTDPAPEPGSLFLAGIGLLAAAGALRMKRRR